MSSLVCKCSKIMTVCSSVDPRAFLLQKFYFFLVFGILDFCSVKVIGSVFGSVLVTTSHGLDGGRGRQIVFFAFDRITVRRKKIFETMIF